MLSGHGAWWKEDDLLELGHGIMLWKRGLSSKMPHPEHKSRCPADCSRERWAWGILGGRSAPQAGACLRFLSAEEAPRNRMRHNSSCLFSKRDQFSQVPSDPSSIPLEGEAKVGTVGLPIYL